MGFTDDLQFGSKYEREFFDSLTNARRITGKFKPYDIIDSNGIKYEVKSDRLASKTGNICIEYMCNQVPSGISSTEADFYIYFVVTQHGYRLYKIPTDDIRDMIEKQVFHKSMSGGDGWRSKFYLFREECFQKYLVL
jgi:hypothetical protein